MKNLITFISIVLLFISGTGYAQSNNSKQNLSGSAGIKQTKAAAVAKAANDNKALHIKWKAGKESMPGNIPAFEENDGEFTNPLNDWKVLYECSNQGIHILFTNKGIIYSVPEVITLKDDDDKLFEKGKKKNEHEKKTTVILHNISMEWEGGNPSAEISGKDITPFYFGALNPVDPRKGIDHIKGYRKIIYRNLYPGIDLEFSFVKGVVKYSILVKGGADLSKYKMLYSGMKNLKIDESGNLMLSTPVADIIDHTPVSFQNGGKISSSFIKTGENEVSFSIDQTPKGAPVTIDPTLTVSWYIHPTTISYRPSDIGMDQFSNTYTLGYDATDAEYVQQYSPSGVLNWTYSLTQYGSGETLADMAVDKNGNTYIASPFSFINSSGFQYALISLDISGALNYFNDNNTSTSIFEIWNLAYSCGYNLLVQAGSPTILESQISTINTSNGNLGTVVINTTIGEIYAGCLAPNGYYYGLSANTSFSGNARTDQLNCYDISSGTPVLLWNTNSTYNFDDYEFKNENSIGDNGVASGCEYLYTTGGDSIHQRSLTDGSVINGILLPGGKSSVDSVNSGLAVDPDCGNVYAGSYYGVYAYDQNLNALASYTGLPGVVLGVAFNNGLVSACGGQVTFSTDTAFIIQFDALACTSQLSVTGTSSTCYKSNGTATANPTFCGAPYTYFWYPSGQTSQTATGLSAGTYTVTVSPQGVCTTVSDTIIILTTPDFTVTPTVTDTLSCLENISIAISGGTSPFTYFWSNGNTTTVIKEVPYGNYIISITDSGGSCTITDTIQAKGGALTSILPQPALCSVANSGTATLVISGGNPPFTYMWSNGETSQNDTDLVTGTYTVTITDNGGCTFKDTVIINNYPKPNIVVSPILDSACYGIGTPITATGGSTYLWNPAAGLSCNTCQSPTATPTATTTYTVIGTDTNGCTNTAIATIKVIPTPRPVITGRDSICVGTDDTLTATGGSTYLWNNGATTSSISGVITSSRTVTVTAYFGTCSHDTTFTINAISLAPRITPSKDSTCSGDTVKLSASGGVDYLWSNSSTSTSIIVSPIIPTTYTLYTSFGSCKDSATITIGIVKQTTATISSSADSVCPGTNVSLIITASGGTGTYKWSNGSTTSTINVNDSVTTTYTATIYGKCDTVPYTITNKVVALPKPVITGTNWKCKGVKDTLTVSGGTTYLWNDGSTKTTYITGEINADSTFTVVAYNSLHCPDTAHFTITSRTIPDITVTSENACSGEPVEIVAKATGTGPFTYSWSPGGQTTDSISVVSPPDSTTATYTVTVSNGCPASKTISVTAEYPVMNTCCNQTLIIENDTAILTASGNSVNYQWQDSNGVTCIFPPPLCDSVRVTPTVTTTYTVIGTDKEGCQIRGYITVSIEVPCLNFTVPNVFTPNYAGSTGNDNVFYIKTEHINAWAITIYDRWGKEMFKSSNQYQYWNGTTESGAQAPDGVYYYIITGTCQSTTYKKDGFVQLIR